jgi:hypothetical protein
MGRRRLALREHWALAPAVFLLSIPLAYVSTAAALFSWVLLRAGALARRTKRKRLSGSVLGIDSDEVRRLVLGLPEVEEYEHGGLPSFRVRGRRFASMLGTESVNLAPGEVVIRAAVGEWPSWCSEEWFGKRLVAVRVAFTSISGEILEELVMEAWPAKAPKTLIRALPNAAAGKSH